MAALVDVVTRFRDLVHTVFRTANVLESLFRVIVGFLDFDRTESAFARPCEVFSLFTRMPQVVRLALALSAEVSTTIRAPHTVLGHILRRLLRQNVTLLILLLIVNFGAWLEHDGRFALHTLKQVGRQVDPDIHLLLFDLVHLLFG
jgi:hypothetical protein